MNVWDAYTPTAADPWDLKKVGHLYRRAAFGATGAEMREALANGPENTIAALLAGGPSNDDFEKTSEFMAAERSLPSGAATRQLAAWWLYRLLNSPHPLREKLTLFWHNHFATSNAKVQNARLMLGQYRTLHRHAFGSFIDLLHAVSVDPAMMVWLDSIDSKKGMANENYARELMELFSLGRGHYSEADIREAAKAFTGYRLKSGAMTLVAKEHDNGVKKVFGKSGAYKPGEVVDLCLAQPACAKFIVAKLYRYFISETQEPTADLLAPLAEQYRASGFDTARLVGVMLRSKLFFSEVAYRQKVKSPVEFAVGIVRSLEGKVGPLPLAEALEGLGQVLFAPPSVKGWDGGTAWLNTQTLLFRQNLALALTSGDDSRFGDRCDPWRMLAKHSDDTALDTVVELFLQSDLPAASRAKLKGYLDSTKNMPTPPFWTSGDVSRHRHRTLVHLVLSLPEYQLC